MDSWRSLNRAKSVPRGSQERPRAAKSARERPKSVPRASPERPKSGQERPRAPKSAPRERSWRPRRLQEGVLGGSWEDLGSILKTFGGCLDAMLEFGERIRSDYGKRLRALDVSKRKLNRVDRRLDFRGKMF